MTDPALELLPWFAQTGADIAPCAPLAYSASLVPGKRPSLLLESAGSADPTGKLYPGVLWAPGSAGKAAPRPTAPYTGNVAFDFEFMVDSATVAGGNTLETDAVFVKNGLKYNGSFQRKIGSGELDIGGWTKTGLSAGEIAPDVWHPASTVWFLNETAKTLAFVAYVCDGVTYPAPAGLASIAATACDWIDTVDGSAGVVYNQLQHNLLPSGAPMLTRYRGVANRFW